MQLGARYTVWNSVSICRVAAGGVEKKKKRNSVDQTDGLWCEFVCAL